MTWSGGEDGRRDSRSPSQPGGTLRPSELWAACVAFTGKGAAIPGGKTRVCLTCSWRRLSSWEKQEHHGLWSRLLWMNLRGGRGQEKGILRAERRLDAPGAADFWEMQTTITAGRFPLAKCNQNLNSFLPNILPLVLLLFPNTESEFRLVILSKNFTRLVLSLEI